MNEKQPLRYGIVVAASFIFWGLMPLYWKPITHISPWETLAYRIAGAFICAGILLKAPERTALRKMLVSKKQVIIYSTAAILLGINWVVFIWAVNNGQTIQASMGYFVNPLLNVVLGAVLLKERISKVGMCAFILALAGVIVRTFHYGLPWVTIALAVSFAGYALIRKTGPLPAMSALTFETAVTGVPSVIFLIWLESKGQGLFSSGWAPALLLSGAGFMTAAPLMLFGYGIKRLRLITVGFLQYLAPSLQLMVAALIFKEDFAARDFISFGLIWGAILLYMYGLKNRKSPEG